MYGLPSSYVDQVISILLVSIGLIFLVWLLK